MGSLWSKSDSRGSSKSDSPGLSKRDSSPPADEPSTDEHLFFEDPLLTHQMSNCFHNLSKESIDEFLAREGSGGISFYSSGEDLLPSVEQLNRQLAVMEGVYVTGPHYDFSVGLQVRRRDISGSVADHLGSATIDCQPYTFASDLDIMYELDLEVEFAGECPISGNVFVAHPSTNHVGFFSVRPDHAVPRDFWRDEDGIPFLADTVREQFAEAARRVGLSGVTVNGPAVTCQDPNVRLSYDLVPCLRVAWPYQWLADFQQRPRPTGWPGPQLLDRLRGSLHLVTKPPYRGEIRLWRVSFSRPESLLAQGLPPAAHFCLLMLRAARSAVGAQASLVAPYYLKMCVFWLCERQSPERWEEQPVAAMCTVLDALRLFATAGFLPNFLRPGINVLGRPTAAYRRRLYQQVTNLRRQLQPVLEDLMARFSRLWEQLAPGDAQPAQSQAATSADSELRIPRSSLTAIAEERARPPRDFFIHDQVMAFVPDEILNAAMNSEPSADFFVEDMRNTIQLHHWLEEPIVNAGADTDLESYRHTWF